ncbi:uncharacterized protein AruCF_2828 [Achromobacter ruhlandii]|nr:uncharacterized protein AruCF_2828 [Achromobacter ruhlandii]
MAPGARAVETPRRAGAASTRAAGFQARGSPDPQRIAMPGAGHHYLTIS